MKRNPYLFTAVLIVSGILLFYLFNSGESGREKKPESTVLQRPQWTATDSLIFRYREKVIDRIDSSEIVGGALAMVLDGRVVIMKCFGETLQGSGNPVNKHTIFRLASVSKPISGVLAGILDEKGSLPLDTRLSDYIPGFRLKDSLNTLNLCAENLLSHTSGLVPHAYDNLVEAGVNMGIILDSLYRVNISASPGLLYGYQNVIFSLYDTLSHRVTGKSFEKLMKEEVFDPLHMPNASVGLLPYLESDNKAFPHSRTGRLYKELVTQNGYYITLPAAGVNASIYDLSSFMLAMLGHSDNLSQTTIDRILSPRVNSPLNWRYLRNWQDVKGKYYALGWRIIDAWGSRLAYHGGYIRGYRSELLICEEEDFGIAWLSNSPSGVDSELIPMFLDMYFENSTDHPGHVQNKKN
jgi:beta-lactamase class C